MSQESNEAKTQAARERLPLRRLLEQHGSGPRDSGQKWNSFKCPFCDRKAASVFHPNNAPAGIELFKCFNTGGKNHGPCPTGSKALDEVGFLAQLLGCSRQDAWIAYLKEAGVYEEAKYAPSVMPGQRPRRKLAPRLEENDPSKRDTNDERNEKRSEKDLVGEAVSKTTEPAESPETPEAHNQLEGGLDSSKPQAGKETARAEGDSEGGDGPPPISPVSAGEESSRDTTAPAFSENEKSEEAGRPRATEGRKLDEFEKLLVAAVDAILSELMCSRTFLKMRFSIGDQRVAEVIKALQERGILGAEGDGGLFGLKISSKATASLALSIGRGEGSHTVGTGRVSGGDGEKFLADDADDEDGNGGGSGGGDGGDGGGGNGEPPFDEEGGERKRSDDELALLALREFYGRLTWKPEDEEKMWQKRGILPATCRMAGLRSSGPENEAILRELAEKFGNGVMIKAGLYKYDEEEQRARPERQFCGWGVIGKKEKVKVNQSGARGATRPTSDLEWGACCPVLIPYFNAGGELIGLRPHKGNPRGGKARLYVVRSGRASSSVGSGSSAERAKRVVVCEGEFKALAVWQVFNSVASGEGRVASGGEVECAAVPGISMVRNKAIEMEMRDWLRMMGRVKEVLVGFDSEEKGDPKLASFKEDPWKRHDTEVYARYLAGWVKGQASLAGRAGVVFLPKEWRDEKGKADWDSCLARMLAGDLLIGGVVARSGQDRHDPAHPSRLATDQNIAQPEEAARAARALPSTSEGLDAVVAFWNSKRVEIRKAFAEVLKGAIEPTEFLGGNEAGQEEMFYGTPNSPMVDDEGERIIKNRLEQMWREPLLPYGDDAELELKRKFMRLGYQKDVGALSGWQGKSKILGQQFGEVLGWYYKRVPKVKMSADERDAINAGMDLARQLAKSSGEPDWVTFFEEYVKGAPVGVADFRMNCRFALMKSNGDRVLMVSLRSHHDKTQLVQLDARSFTSARDFKEWCQNQGGFAWMTGDTEREMLQHDMNHQAAYLKVYELSWFGWHEGPELWVFQDCAITPHGTLLKPDPNGIIWWRGMGYMMGDVDLEGEEFKLGAPRMKPDLGLRIGGFEESGNCDTVYQLEEGEDDTEAILSLFCEVTEKMQETQAGQDRANLWEGAMILGATLAYAAARNFSSRKTGGRAYGCMGSAAAGRVHWRAG
jgi:hypothetical protein